MGVKSEKTIFAKNKISLKFSIKELQHKIMIYLRRNFLKEMVKRVKGLMRDKMFLKNKVKKEKQFDGNTLRYYMKY